MIGKLSLSFRTSINYGQVSPLPPKVNYSTPKLHFTTEYGEIRKRTSCNKKFHIPCSISGSQEIAIKQNIFNNPRMLFFDIGIEGHDHLFILYKQ